MQDWETNVFLLQKLVHSLKIYLVKCPQLVQIASARQSFEVCIRMREPYNEVLNAINILL